MLRRIEIVEDNGRVSLKIEPDDDTAVWAVGILDLIRDQIKARMQQMPRQMGIALPGGRLPPFPNGG